MPPYSVQQRLALFSLRHRLMIGAALAAAAIGGALLIVAFATRSPATPPLGNAIWLDGAWTYGEANPDDLRALADRLLDYEIGSAYAYASSLGIDGRWSGGPQGEGDFAETSERVKSFRQTLKAQNDSLRVYGWIEIWTHLDNVDGYRLDDIDLHGNVAQFSRTLVRELGFDGVLLDVKPLFRDSNDFIRLIRGLRRTLGPEVPIAVAVTADLSPDDSRLQALESIAPGTMWSANFKKQVMVSADEVVLMMAQSYRQTPRDYVNWVAYHVESYLNELESATKVLVSAPNYGAASSAHNPAIETMENALEGVGKGLRWLDEGKRARLTGIAIYTDARHSQSSWNAFRDLWLQR